MGRILRHIAAFAALLTAGAFLVGGVEPGLGALAGGVVAVANWIALRWTAERVLVGGSGQRAAMSLLLVLKLAAVGAVCWALIVNWGTHPVGFLVGVSAFVLGTLIGSSHDQPMAEEKG